MGALILMLVLLSSWDLSNVAGIDPCEDSTLVNTGPVRVDPDNCAGYVMCEHVGNFKRTHYKDCRHGLIFDPVPLWCDYCEKVNCGDRPLPDGHCDAKNDTTTTTTEAPPPLPEELLGEKCQDAEGLVRFVITNYTNAYYRLRDGFYEYVDCGPWMFSPIICTCDAPGAKSFLWKDQDSLKVAPAFTGIFPIVYDFEGDFKATKPGHNRVWTGVYENAYIVPGGIVHKYAAMFDGGRMEIPYFQNTFFEEMTVAFFYKRSSEAGSGTMGLVNNGLTTQQPSVQIFCEMTYLRLSLLTNVTTYEMQYRDKDAPLSPDSWHHVALVLNHTSLMLFVNGTMKLQEDVQGTMLRRPQSSMIVGHDRYIDVDLGRGTSKYVGMMDDLRFYDWALDDEEVLALYNSRNNNN